MFALLSVSGLLILGRISGFAREIALASTFGVSAISDAAIVVLTLPDLMVSLILAGGIKAALIPGLKNTKPQDRQLFVLKSFCVFGIIFVCLGIFVAVNANLFLFFLAPSLTQNAVPGLLAGFRLSLVALPLLALLGVASSYLNVIGRFAPPPLSVCLYNILIIFYLTVFTSRELGLVGLALVIIFANLLRLLIQLFFMRGLLFSLPVRGWALKTFPDQFLKQFVMGVLSYLIIIGVPIFFRSLYSLGGDGSLAIFNFSQKLFEFGSAVLVAPFVTVIMPKLAAVLGRNSSEFANIIVKSGVALACLCVVVSAVGIVFIQYYVDLIFLNGAMTDTDVKRISFLTSIFLLGLPFFGISQICMVGLYAKGEAFKSFKICLLGFLVSGFFTSVIYQFKGTTFVLAPALGYCLFNIFIALFFVNEFKISLGKYSDYFFRVMKRLILTLLGIAMVAIATVYFYEELTPSLAIAVSLPLTVFFIWLNIDHIKPAFKIVVDDT